MSRKRMIDPQIWGSEDFATLSYLARLIWIGLFSNADDEGRGKLNSSYIKSIIFPYDDDMTTKKIENALKEIEETMSVRYYQIENKKYYQLLNWSKFQTINRPSPSQIPSPNTDNSLNTHGVITEYSHTNNEQISDGSFPKKNIREIEDKYKYIKEESVKEESGTSPLSTHAQKHKYGLFGNVLLTEEEYKSLLTEQDGAEAIEYFSNYREMKGYKCKNDNLAIRKWAFAAVKEERQRNQRVQLKPGVQASQKVSAEEAAVWKC